jgi:hypothetical protein
MQASLTWQDTINQGINDAFTNASAVKAVVNPETNDVAKQTLNPKPSTAKEHTPCSHHSRQAIIKPVITANHHANRH